MGKWSQYRLRGTVRRARQSTPVLLLERAPTGSEATTEVGQASANQYVAAKPIIIDGGGWLVSRVELYMSRTGSPAASFSAVFWGEDSLAPDLPRLATSSAVAGSSLPMSLGWVSFDFSPWAALSGPLATFLGLAASGVNGSAYANWRHAGSGGGGVLYYGAADPPTTNSAGASWPWLRVYGIEL